MHRITKTRALVVAVLVGLSCSFALGAGRVESPNGSAAASETLADGWYARIETSHGEILVELLPQQAPQGVAHFAAFANGEAEWLDPLSGESQRGPYYDGIAVHLAEAGQRFEAGNKSGTGRQAPELYLPPEVSGPVDFSSPGRLGMTRASGGRISAVQFFLTASGAPWLSRNHPCLGRVRSGLDVIRAISSVKTYPNGRPLEPPIIEKIRVFSVGEVTPLAERTSYFPKLKPMELRRDRGNS